MFMRSKYLQLSASPKQLLVNCQLPAIASSVLPTTSNHGKNVDEGEIPPTISKPNIIFSKVPATNNNIGENADDEEEIQLIDVTAVLLVAFKKKKK